MDKLPEVKVYGPNKKAWKRKAKWYGMALVFAAGGVQLLREGEGMLGASAIGVAAALGGYETHRDKVGIGQESRNGRKLAVLIGLGSIVLAGTALFGKVRAIGDGESSGTSMTAEEYVAPATTLPGESKNRPSETTIIIPSTTASRSCDFATPIANNGSAESVAAIKELQAAMNLTEVPEYSVGDVDGIELKGGPTEQAVKLFMSDNGYDGLFSEEMCLALDQMPGVEGLLTDGDMTSAQTRWDEVAA